MNTHVLKEAFRFSVVVVSVQPAYNCYWKPDVQLTVGKSNGVGMWTTEKI